MSATESTRLRALRPLASRDYRLLFAAVGVEVFGTGMWTIVMVFQVLALDDSPLALSAVATGLSLGLLAFAMAGGVIADRYSQRRILITVQASTAAVMTAVAVLALTGGIQLWQLAAASFALGAGSAFFFPAYSAYLPRILPPEQLLAANGLEGALRPTLGQGLGPALGGLIVGAFLPAAGAVVVAASFALAFVLLLFLSRDDGGAGDGGAADAGMSDAPASDAGAPDAGPVTEADAPTKVTPQEPVASGPTSAPVSGTWPARGGCCGP